MKKIRTREQEFRIPRLIITISLVGMIVGYVLCVTIGDMKYNAIVPAVILMFAGVFLFTLGVVIKRQERRVELDYDSIVVWKMCVVAGFLCFLAGVFSLIMGL